MRILVNGEQVDTDCTTVSELREKLSPGCLLCLLDGRPASGDEPITENCRIFFSEDVSDITSAVSARVSPGIREVLGRSTVGIAGAGGLGSNIATYLARSGLKKIVIADFDRVEFSNLNRQNYSLLHLGMYKVDALEEVIREINPEICIEKHTVKLDPSNITDIFTGCDVVCEAFDDPASKAMMLETVAEVMPNTPLVCGSGMAGIGDTDDMTVRRLSDTIFVCGDGKSDMTSLDGMISPRVSVCAGIMANKVLQLLVSKKAEHVRRPRYR